MKFAQVKQGKLARRLVPFTSSTGVACECDVRVMLAVDAERALERAIAKTKARGGEPVVGNEMFDLQKAAEYVYECALDPAVTDKEERYFASGDEVKGALDPDRIAYLYKQQLDLQRETAPLLTELGKDAYHSSLVDAMRPAKEGDEDPFWKSWEKWGPSLQRTWCRTTAALSFSSLITRSHSGTEQSDATASDTTPKPTP